jgi:hypothetical protein
MPRLGGYAPAPGMVVARLDLLVRAAAEVRAALRELTQDATTLARPEVIATRVSLDQATAATLRAIESGLELAHVVAEKADNHNLTGPARALSPGPQRRRGRHRHTTPRGRLRVGLPRRHPRQAARSGPPAPLPRSFRPQVQAWLMWPLLPQWQPRRMSQMPTTRQRTQAEAP